MAKACHAPADLTDSEVIILDKYFGRLISRVSVNYNGANVGGFEKVHSALSDWKNRSAGYLMEIMEYPAGRHYLKTHPFWSNPGVAYAGHEIAAYLLSWSIGQDTTALQC